MTGIKLCGLSRPEDIQAANELKVDYIGFVFAQKSRRYVAPERAAALKKLLSPQIRAVGVFVNEMPETVAELLRSGTIDFAQLHGQEDGDYIQQLRALTDKPIIQAFRIASAQDCKAAQESTADYILLDSGAGTGESFDWTMIGQIQRPYFLAGGLSSANAADCVRRLQPYAVDVSSGIETNGVKDPIKMAEFVSAVRKEDRK